MTLIKVQRDTRFHIHDTNKGSEIQVFISMTLIKVQRDTRFHILDTNKGSEIQGFISMTLLIKKKLKDLAPQQRLIQPEVMCVHETIYL